MHGKLKYSVVIYADFELDIANHFVGAVVLPEHGQNRVWFETAEAAEQFRRTLGRALTVSSVLCGPP